MLQIIQLSRLSKEKAIETGGADVTLRDKQYKEMIEHIIYYSQDEGMRDAEIAQTLGCSRATVNRARSAHEVPTANLRNRKDKEVICERCEETYFIRRRERRKRLCEKCQLESGQQ